MPKITIQSDIRGDRPRRMLAKRLTLAMGRLGVDVGHVLIRWHYLESGDVFAGPLPLANIQAADAPANFGFIEIEVDQQRQHEWRRNLIAEVIDASNGIFDRHYLFIRIIPVDPSDYWNMSLEASRKASGGVGQWIRSQSD